MNNIFQLNGIKVIVMWKTEEGKLDLIFHKIKWKKKTIK